MMFGKREKLTISMYGCKFLRSQLSLSKESVMTIYGIFDRLAKEQEISKKYFEFILKQEILIDGVEFCDGDKHRSSTLIFD